MEQGTGFRFPKKLVYEAEGAIGRHISRPEDPVGFFFPGAVNEPDQQEPVEHQLCFPGGPAIRGSGDRPAPTAAGDQAIDPGTGQGQHGGNCEDVKDIRALSSAAFRADPIESRQKEDSPEQAHISEARQAELLKGSKELDAQNSDDHMQDRQRSHPKRPDPQSFALGKQPDTGEDCRKQQDQNQAATYHPGQLPSPANPITNPYIYTILL